MTELTDRELAVMQVLWRNGPTTAERLRAELPNRPDNSTVRTFLRVLERKGHITHHKRGRSFVYRAVTTQDQAARAALNALLNRFFKGSFKALESWASAGKAGKPPRRRREHATSPPASGTPPTSRGESDQEPVWLL